MSTRKLLYVFLTALVLTGGCAFKRKTVDHNRKPRVLAVMPFDNLSNDVAGAEVCRRKIYDALLGQEYIVLDLERTDSVLRGLGVTDGGQLKAVEMAKLAEGLKTNTFVTGEVVEYFQGASLEVVPFGFCFKRHVKFRVTVKDILAGQLLFTKEKQLVRKEPLDKSGDKKKKGEKEPSFIDNALGGVIRNAVADTVHSGAENMAERIAEDIVNEMPYYYEK